MAPEDQEQPRSFRHLPVLILLTLCALAGGFLAVCLLSPGTRQEATLSGTRVRLSIRETDGIFYLSSEEVLRSLSGRTYSRP